MQISKMELRYDVEHEYLQFEAEKSKNVFDNLLKTGKK
jgi:hypothetical protein